MLSTHRRALLLERLRNDGQIVATQLATELGTSEDTIRRDLRELASEGKLQRVHGGALPLSPAVADFPARLDLAPDGKRAVARAAVQLIEPGQTVVLDGGTTSQQLARSLPGGLAITVITHSPTIAVELAAHDSVEVIVLGGRLFKHSVVTSGAITSEAISRVRADAFFMGVTGVHPTAGLTTGDAEEAATKRALSARCGDTYVLASAEKIGAASAFGVLGLDEVTGVITDAAAPAKVLTALRRQHVQIIVAR